MPLIAPARTTVIPAHMFTVLARKVTQPQFQLSQLVVIREPGGHLVVTREPGGHLVVAREPGGHLVVTREPGRHFMVSRVVTVMVTRQIVGMVSRVVIIMVTRPPRLIIVTTVPLQVLFFVLPRVRLLVPLQRRLTVALRLVNIAP